MKQKIVFLIFILFFISCQKDENNPKDNGNLRIKSYSINYDDGDTELFTFEYDEHIIKINNTAVYSGIISNFVETETYNENNKITKLERGTFGINGQYIINSITNYSYSTNKIIALTTENQITDTAIIIYTDNQGRIISSDWNSDGTLEEIYAWTDQNLLSSSFEDSKGIYSDVYEYDISKNNPFFSLTNNLTFNISEGLYFPLSKNFPTKASYKFYSKPTGNVQEWTDINYVNFEFNQQGFPTKGDLIITSNYPDDNQTMHVVLSYENYWFKVLRYAG